MSFGRTYAFSCGRSLVPRSSRVEQPPNPHSFEHAWAKRIPGVGLRTLARDYLDLPTVEEDERLAMEKITTSLQKLLTDNHRMSDAVTGASAQTRKLLGGLG
jgi:hypothetical protein